MIQMCIRNETKQYGGLNLTQKPSFLEI